MAINTLLMTRKQASMKVLISSFCPGLWHTERERERRKAPVGFSMCSPRRQAEVLWHLCAGFNLGSGLNTQGMFWRDLQPISSSFSYTAPILWEHHHKHSYWSTVILSHTLLTLAFAFSLSGVMCILWDFGFCIMLYLLPYIFICIYPSKCTGYVQNMNHYPLDYGAGTSDNLFISMIDMPLIYIVISSYYKWHYSLYIL